MAFSKPIQVVVIGMALLACRTVHAYTERPGPREGALFRDRWNRTWFLRASAVLVGEEIAGKGAKLTGRPIVLEVTELELINFQPVYQRGSVETDQECRAESSLLRILVELDKTVYELGDVPALRAAFSYHGKDNFILRDDHIMIHIFSDQTPSFAGCYLGPHEGLLRSLADVGCQGTRFEQLSERWLTQPYLLKRSEWTIVSLGGTQPPQIQETVETQVHVLTIPLVAFNELSKSPAGERKKLKLTDDVLRLPPGEYQLLVTYFHDCPEVRTLSNPVDFAIKQARLPEEQPAGPTRSRVRPHPAPPADQDVTAASRTWLRYAVGGGLIAAFGAVLMMVRSLPRRRARRRVQYVTGSRGSRPAVTAVNWVFHRETCTWRQPTAGHASPPPNVWLPRTAPRIQHPHFPEPSYQA